MNNNIQESYCSKEVSKLLKEKGFEFNMRTAPTGFPTHALAIEWIRVNFGIWIQVFNEEKNFGYDIINIKKKTSLGNLLYRAYAFNSPQQATEAALLYTLQNLI